MSPEQSELTISLLRREADGHLLKALAEDDLAKQASKEVEKHKATAEELRAKERLARSVIQQLTGRCK